MIGILMTSQSCFVSQRKCPINLVSRTFLLLDVCHVVWQILMFWGTVHASHISLCPEDEGRRLCQNVGIYLPNYILSDHRRLQS
jgi:hypothetical protein